MLAAIVFVFDAIGKKMFGSTSAKTNFCQQVSNADETSGTIFSRSCGDKSKNFGGCGDAFLLCSAVRSTQKKCRRVFGTGFFDEFRLEKGLEFFLQAANLWFRKKNLDLKKKGLKSFLRTTF